MKTLKALLVNGSPRAKGCTFTALTELKKTLEAEGIEVELIHVGHRDVRGCIACRKCQATGKCVFDDVVNEVATDKQGRNSRREHHAIAPGFLYPLVFPVCLPGVLCLVFVAVSGISILLVAVFAFVFFLIGVSRAVHLVRTAVIVIFYTIFTLRILCHFIFLLAETSCAGGS